VNYEVLDQKVTKGQLDLLDPPVSEKKEPKESKVQLVQLDPLEQVVFIVYTEILS
jgi:hypothetical protein